MADRFGYGEIGLDINPCRGCEDCDAPDGCKSNGGCGKPITNYDRIVSKSPEELAEWIAGDVLNLRYAALEMATEAWLDWLRKEAEEGE